MSSLDITIGPEALLLATDAQRKVIVQLYEEGKGIRVWTTKSGVRARQLSYKQGDGTCGIITKLGSQWQV